MSGGGLRRVLALHFYFSGLDSFLIMFVLKGKFTLKSLYQNENGRFGHHPSLVS